VVDAIVLAAFSDPKTSPHSRADGNPWWLKAKGKTKCLEFRVEKELRGKNNLGGGSWCFGGCF